jgi:hypothetical protein
MAFYILLRALPLLFASLFVMGRSGLTLMWLSMLLFAHVVSSLLLADLFLL